QHDGGTGLRQGPRHRRAQESGTAGEKDHLARQVKQLLDRRLRLHVHVIVSFGITCQAPRSRLVRAARLTRSVWMPSSSVQGGATLPSTASRKVFAWLMNIVSRSSGGMFSSCHDPPGSVSQRQRCSWNSQRAVPFSQITVSIISLGAWC